MVHRAGSRLGFLYIKWNVITKRSKLCEVQSHISCSSISYHHINEIGSSSTIFARKGWPTRVFMRSKAARRCLSGKIKERKNQIHFFRDRSTSKVSLPKIKLPQFSEDYQSLRPFHDASSTPVCNNPDLTNVMKIHYLKSGVIGDSWKLFSWHKLVARYENKLVLIKKHLNTIF